MAAFSRRHFSRRHRRQGLPLRAVRPRKFLRHLSAGAEQRHPVTNTPLQLLQDPAHTRSRTSPRPSCVTRRPAAFACRPLLVTILCGVVGPDARMRTAAAVERLSVGTVLLYGAAGASTSSPVVAGSTDASAPPSSSAVMVSSTPPVTSYDRAAAGAARCRVSFSRRRFRAAARGQCLPVGDRAGRNTVGSRRLGADTGSSSLGGHLTGQQGAHGPSVVNRARTCPALPQLRDTGVGARRRSADGLVPPVQGSSSRASTISLSPCSLAEASPTPGSYRCRGYVVPGR